MPNVNYFSRLNGMGNNLNAAPDAGRAVWNDAVGPAGNVGDDTSQQGSLSVTGNGLVALESDDRPARRTEV